MRINAKHILLITLIASLVSLFVPSSQLFANRKYIHIVGSSTIYPIITAAGEIFGTETPHRTPVIESTGTGGGVKVFCNGAGDSYPDLVVTSRPMSAEEIKYCVSNGVRKLVRFVIGYDGIVIAETDSKRVHNLQMADLFDALKKFTDKEGKKIKNPLHDWSQINANYNPQKIKILGPPSTSGTKQTFLQLIFNPKIIKEKSYAYPPELRDDLTYIDTAEQETVTATKLHLEEDAIGIFSYGFLIKNRDKIHAIPINHVLPRFETITDGSYPLSRSLYIYVKGENLHTTEALDIFLKFFFSDPISGLKGYLKNYGLIPLPTSQFQEETYKLLSFLDVHGRG